MSWFCYACVAKKVKSGEVRPLVEVWGAPKMFLFGIIKTVTGAIYAVVEKKIMTWWLRTRRWNGF